ncbi:LysR family transcriptional regulator [Mesorhizobium sp. KR9-304]|uniref:LysR family transcriptional regulator n=1 Tax=Mesorhizobium sp. KR9-304 TaxID=3156614 RepID=UPI0032B5689E
MANRAERQLSESLSARRFVRNLDWNLIKVFHEIVKNDGVTNAAKAMSRQQPAVSSALKRLEDYLGKILCERGPGGFALTDHGIQLAELAAKLDQLIGSLQTVLDEIDNELTIQLQIATVGNIVSDRFDRTIRAFAVKYPRAELSIHVAPYPQIEDMVLNGDADVGICPDPRMDSRLSYEFLFSERHLVVCGPTHPLANRITADFEALADEAFVIPGTDEAQIVKNFRLRYGWGRRKAGQSLDYGELKRLLMAGVGVALLPNDTVLPELEQGKLCAVTDLINGLEDDIFLVTNAASPRYFAASKFLELLPPRE